MQLHKLLIRQRCKMIPRKLYCLKFQLISMKVRMIKYLFTKICFLISKSRVRTLKMVINYHFDTREKKKNQKKFNNNTNNNNNNNFNRRFQKKKKKRYKKSQNLYKSFCFFYSKLIREVFFHYNQKMKLRRYKMRIMF